MIRHKRKPNLRNQLRSIMDRRNGYYGGFTKGRFQLWQCPISYGLYPGYVNLNHILPSGRIESKDGNVQLKLEAPLNPIGNGIIAVAFFGLLLLVNVMVLSTETLDKAQLIAPSLTLMIPAGLFFAVIRYKMKAEIRYFISELGKKIERMP